MGKKTEETLTIVAEWETSLQGAPEERACFAEICMDLSGSSLSEVEDRLVGRIRNAPLLSGYKLAEWLAWNWWRLRWEPRRDNPAWQYAHNLSSIGGGYVWPNITFTSLGDRVFVAARPTEPTPNEPLRYIADKRAVVPADMFENALSDFLNQVQQQLRMEQVDDTNFDRVWNAVQEERQDPATALWRRLEATMGFDPDEADPAVIDQLVTDTESLGIEGIAELAAASGPKGLITGSDIKELAQRLGTAFNPKDTISLSAQAQRQLMAKGTTVAEQGAAAAKALLAQEKFEETQLSNGRLAELLGLNASVIGASDAATVSFSLDQSARSGAIVLGSKWETGRRFALARLLGDRLLYRGTDKLRPATEAVTSRQQKQKAFATELLCPFEALDAMLNGDFSTEATEEAARYFNVSPLTVRASLANHGRLGRRDVEQGLAA